MITFPPSKVTFRQQKLSETPDARIICEKLKMSWKPQSKRYESCFRALLDSNQLWQLGDFMTHISLKLPNGFYLGLNRQDGSEIMLQIETTQDEPSDEMVEEKPNEPGCVQRIGTYMDSYTISSGDIIYRRVTAFELMECSVSELGKCNLEQCKFIIGSVLKIVRGHEIKPETIMFDSDGRIKLLDLGITKFDLTLTIDTRMIMFCAPEILNGRLNQTSNMYSLGRVLQFLYTGKRNWSFITCDFEIDQCDEKLYQLLSIMLNADPNKRSNPADLLQHPFFISVD